MLNLLDDCSRLFTGSKIYERELLLSYFDFLPAAFLAHGRPLQICVDYHILEKMSWCVSISMSPSITRTVP